jgi:hypothetical protein
VRAAPACEPAGAGPARGEGTGLPEPRRCRHPAAPFPPGRPSGRNARRWRRQGLEQRCRGQDPPGPGRTSCRTTTCSTTSSTAPQARPGAKQGPARAPGRPLTATALVAATAAGMADDAASPRHPHDAPLTCGAAGVRTRRSCERFSRADRARCAASHMRRRRAQAPRSWTGLAPGGYGCWQRGQKLVARPATIVRTITVPHTRQGWPCRRNTSA